MKIIIKLTIYGESIRALGENIKYIDDISLGQHQICNGFIDCEQVSKTHKALICRKCKLRVLIPIKIKTWQDLRNYAEQALEGNDNGI